MVEPTTLAVHRCRFVDFTPSAITALAFPPLPLPPVKGKKSTSGKQPLKFGTLAVGHANGNIDLCEWAGAERQIQTTQAWVVRKTLSGPFPSKVDSLAFVIRHPESQDPDDVPLCSDLRLFSSGGGSELLEWDLERGCVRRTISSQGGSIWSIAANPASTLLALGCEDGTVRLLSLAHDTLTHHRRFDRVKCRVLSIAWGPPLPRQTTHTDGTVSDDSSDDDDEEDWSDAWLVTGGSDSSLRKWEVSTGRVIDRMGTDKMRGERTLVWAVGVLGDGTIVSGDSLGMVKFWDSRTCTQLQSFEGHGADVLCLTIGPEGTTVYTSGVDQRISQFSFVKTSNPEKGATTLLRSSSRWIKSCSRRMHSHDVRALATWPPYTTLPPSHKRKFPIDVAPILASGGLDMSVVVTPAALPINTVVKVLNPLSTSTESTFEDSFYRRLAYTSGTSSSSAVCVARSARLVSCTRDTGLSVWRILRKQTLSHEDDLGNEAQEIPETGGWEKVLDMELNVHTNLIASRMSDNGRWLVVSDLYEAKLFSIETDTNGDLKPKRVRDFSSILQAHLPVSTGGLAFSFTPDSSKLVMSTAMSSQVIVIDLGMDEDKPRVLRRFDHHRIRNTIIGDRVVKGRKNDMEVEVTEPAADDEPEEGSLSENVNITRIAVSPDGQWLATSDDHCRTHVFNLDSIQHHCVLPSFPQPAQALSFDPNYPSLLIIAFPNNTLQIYNVESRQFPAWSKELCNTLPKRFTHAHDPVLGVTFDPVIAELPSITLETPTPRYALFWGSTWMCKMKLGNPLSGGGLSKKRRRETHKSAPPQPSAQKTDGPQDDQSSRDFKMITHYRPMLFVDFLAAGELVVVERPLVDVLSNLPPAYFKHKYGTS